jgi:hypothetical protein
MTITDNGDDYSIPDRKFYSNPGYLILGINSPTFAMTFLREHGRFTTLMQLKVVS